MASFNPTTGEYIYDESDDPSKPPQEQTPAAKHSAHLEQVKEKEEAGAKFAAEEARAAVADPGTYLPTPAMPSPAHKVVQDTQWSSTQKVPTAAAKQINAEMADAEKQRIAAAQQMGQAKVAAAQGQIESANKVAELQSAHEKHVAEVTEESNREIAARKAQYDQRFQQWSKAEIKDYWADKTTNQKVTAGIAMALGVLGQVFTAKAGRDPGKNAALETINGAIERDFVLQKARIDKQAQAVEVARGDISMAQAWKRGALDDLALKYAASKDRVAAQIAQAQAKAGVPLAEAEANATVQALRADSLQTRAQIESQYAKTVTNSGQKQVIAMDERYSKGGAYRGQGVFAPNGGGVVFSTGNEKKDGEINAANENYQNIRRVMDDIEASYKQHGFEIPYVSSAYQEREGMVSKLTTLMKEQQKLGALAGPDAGILQSQISNPLEMIRGNGAAKIQKARQTMDKEHATYLSRFGVDGRKVSRIYREAASGGGAPAEQAGGGQPRRVTLKDGRRGLLHPDGTFDEAK